MSDLQPSVLTGIIIMATALAGIQYYHGCKNDPAPSKLVVDQAFNRLERIYLKRRRELLELIEDMEDQPCGEHMTKDFQADLETAHNSVEGLDRSIGLLIELKRKADKDNVDEVELLEQVQWAEEAQELWMQAIGEVRARWVGEL